VIALATSKNTVIATPGSQSGGKQSMSRHAL
jgi:hypothetical protein